MEAPVSSQKPRNLISLAKAAYWRMRLYKMCLQVASRLAAARLWRVYLEDTDLPDDCSKVFEAAPEYIPVPLRPLGGTPLWIRKNVPTYTPFGDAWSIMNCFGPLGGAHLPPIGTVANDAVLIVDLGANIGCTAADFANRYPRARVIAVELDQSNAALCRRNLEPWAGRCEMVRGAILEADGMCEYGPRGNSTAFHVGDGGRFQAPAFSLNTLLEQHSRGQKVDYLKMDIEGAERKVLTQNTGWSSRVRVISVEIHGGYTAPQCRADLQSIGFEAAILNQWTVYGIRRSPEA